LATANCELAVSRKLNYISVQEQEPDDQEEVAHRHTSLAAPDGKGGNKSVNRLASKQNALMQAIKANLQNIPPQKSRQDVKAVKTSQKALQITQLPKEHAAAMADTT